MRNQLLMKVSILGAALLVPLGAAAAQAWSPGAELVGQTVQVQTQGVVNSIYFAPDGTATIAAPSGTTVPGTWSVANNMLCLNAGGAQECWPYSQPFQSGVQVALTSSCQQMSTFMPGTLNQPMPSAAGERG